MNAPRGDPEDVSGQPDRALMERIREGDAAALDILIRRYWTSLVRYAARYVGRVDLAEDIVQETFVKVWSARERWRPTGSVRSYLFTIARNLGLHERDRQGVRRAWSRRQELRKPVSPDPSELLQQKEVLRTVQGAIEGLPERRREVFVLVCLHGLSYREAAAALDIAVPTVANQMSAALKQLRKALRSVTDQEI